MGLNIKNERVHALAREAAGVTGKSQTGAIEEALARLLEAYGADPAAAQAARKVDVVRRLLADYQRDAGGPGEPATVEELYDDRTGLPS